MFNVLMSNFYLPLFFLFSKDVLMNMFYLIMN